MIEHDYQTAIKDAQAGVAEAFRILFDLLEPKLYAYVRSRVYGHDEAKEIVQDTLVAFFQSLTLFQFQSEGQMYRYIYTIVKRQMAQHYGNKHIKQLHNRVDSKEDTWSVTLNNQEDISAVTSALEKLDEVAKEIIVLHHWSRYTFAEIAIMLEMEEGAVRTRHHRAKLALVKILT